MAHTPKPIRKAAKAARRQRGPRVSFGRSGYGRTVIPFMRQYPSDLGSEYLDLIDRNGGMLINMQALRDFEE